ncbi:hypothetical protein [Pseudonocardia asaccharolytica]|uniref:Uncharacterized protein n=1 Tax=Pseudonocardia asaccharolytica DSM 44247 = NBRC 16224 TaxID=1123024 RepID=A0A511D757_9PSEU|nr:hypothetical protein [Pseudonocardia asaccharolytica]GEL20619.1 hypothetical protein PA7_44560 [Pseudonocardia asaccharolytica DSM 44247 = NBRC 16224]
MRATVTFPKTFEDFPVQIWAPQPVPAIALITCTDYRNPATGAADNVLVWGVATS